MSNLRRIFVLVTVMAVSFIATSGCAVFTTPTPAPTATAVPTRPAPTAQASAPQVGPTAPPPPEVGKPAPEFTLPSVDGEMVSLAGYRGKKVLLVMFATWCPHCQSEAPHLVKASSERSGQGLQVLGVSLGETKEKVQAFQEQYAINYPLLLDQDGAVASLYYARTIPLNILIDDKGVILDGYLGAFDEAQLKEFLDKYLQ